MQYHSNIFPPPAGNSSPPIPPPRCECAVTELRKKICANGRLQYRKQCLQCGRSVGDAIALSAIPNLKAIPPFDESLSKAQERQWQEYRAACAQHLDAKSMGWWDAYDRYLLTPEWRDKRTKVLERDKFACQARMSDCSQKATTAHHLTYRHLFNEPLFDLVATCRNCHDTLHHVDRSNDNRYR